VRSNPKRAHNNVELYMPIGHVELPTINGNYCLINILEADENIQINVTLLSVD